MDRSARTSVTLVVVVMALLGGALMVAVAEARFGGDLRAFLFLGERFHHPPVLQGVPTNGVWGYDGQFYGTLATDPLFLKADTRGFLDDPGYRAGRIVVPLAAWLLAFGRPGAAIWAYLALCWLGSLALVGLIARELHRHGLSPWWAALIGASGGVVTSVFRSTPDGVAVFLALLGLVTQERRRQVTALVLLTLAVLTRETMLLAALAAALAEAGGRRWRSAALYAVVPGAVFLAWRGLVAWRLSVPFLTMGGNLGIPLAWLPAKGSSMISGRLGLFGLEGWGMTAVVVALIAGLVLARRLPLGSLELSFLAFAGLALLLTFNVYADSYAFTRVLLPLPALALLVAGRAGGATRRWLLAVAGANAMVGAVMATIEFGAAMQLLATVRRRMLG